MIKPFYKNLKVGDRVLIKKLNRCGDVNKILPNTFIQFPWSYPNYLVSVGLYENNVFKRSELKLVK